MTPCHRWKRFASDRRFLIASGRFGQTRRAGPSLGAMPFHRSNGTVAASGAQTGPISLTVPWPADVQPGDRILLLAYTTVITITSLNLTLGSGASAQDFVQLGKFSGTTSQLLVGVKDENALGTEDTLADLTDAISVTFTGTSGSNAITMAVMMSFGAADGFATPCFGAFDSAIANDTALTAQNVVTDGQNQLAVQMFGFDNDTGWDGVTAFSAQWDIETFLTTLTGRDGTLGCQTSNDFGDGSDYTAGNVLTLGAPQRWICAGFALRPIGSP